ncbi:hypothetical protein GTS_29710 [Gandjariella thermophila]|uniref:Uncharacterized protein n=1 Tax=Gandjariella thermophila TaxID=1931992 RepID=A0A4D4J9I9_9PSEU|nr:hypothetical protein GTS_29710 [Gandjariella thermophila]
MARLTVRVLDRADPLHAPGLLRLVAFMLFVLASAPWLLHAVRGRPKREASSLGTATLDR